jgi:asparagine synthase (glutamine-hydrolysing)
MCGLTFLYRPGLEDAELRSRTVRALERLMHRGPDDSDIWCAGSAALGHRRLAIIDLAASRQPMLSPDGRYVLVYNGELYNYRELRAELESVWAFQTQGDTEVILAGIIARGESFFNRMEGMWALALWDKQARTLLLARDRMGEKPIYYQSGAEGMACASELPALAQLSGTTWHEDLDSTADYLRYGYYLPGCTAYQHVQEVLPGHILLWSPKHGIERTTPYWSLQIGKFKGQKSDASEQLRERLKHAVRRRMVADVEVGAFLSGGIDSSIIVGIMSKDLGITPQTFTIGFNEKSYDERPYAKTVSELWRTTHHEQVLESWDRNLLNRLILRHVGQPFTDSSLLPTALVSKLTSQHVKVSLSGDGGDELFSGYQRYTARTFLRWYTRLPKTLRRITERMIRALPEPMVHHSHSLLKKAQLFLDIVERQKSETPYVAPVYYSKSAFKELAPDLADRGHRPPSLPDVAREDSILEMMAADALIYLPQDILAKVDRASMAYSLESRCPFLDRDVVEFAFSLPVSWHRRAYRGKRMLHTAFADIVPRSIWKRRKHGFGVPIHDWFRQELGKELETMLNNTHTPVNHHSVLRMLESHRRGQRDHGYRLWGIYVYLLWQMNLTTTVS